MGERIGEPMGVVLAPPFPKVDKGANRVVFGSTFPKGGYGGYISIFLGLGVP